LKTLGPASEKPRLEAHEALIRDMETRLDSATNGGDLVNGCVPGTKPTDPAGLNRFLDNGMFNGTRQGMGDQEEHKQVALLHFAILHAALACDMTRVARVRQNAGRSRHDPRHRRHAHDPARHQRNLRFRPPASDGRKPLRRDGFQKNRAPR
jgi:hypothetical protein